MRECDNGTHKIHISSNFILSISLLIMFDTFLLRPSLHCKTLLLFTTLHPTTLHYTWYASPHFTQLHLSTLHVLSFTLHFPYLVHFAAKPVYLCHPTTAFSPPILATFILSAVHYVSQPDISVFSCLSS
jgi:hypothetical protein